MRNPYKAPRRAHCLGCGETFPKMHLMINHRRLFRCGGRFLPSDERELRLAAKLHFQKWFVYADPWHHAQAKDMEDRANKLRKRRRG